MNTVSNPSCPSDTPEPNTTCPPISFRSGNTQYSYQNGCIVGALLPEPLQLKDGFYTNANISIQGGQIISVQSGDAIKQSIPSLCSGGVGGQGSGLTSSGGVCNLLVQDAQGNYSANFYHQDSDYIDTSGCGTVGNPFIASLNIDSLMATLFEGGIDYDKCGMTIEGGLLTAMPNPNDLITFDTTDLPNLVITKVGECGFKMSSTAGSSSQGAVLYTRKVYCEDSNSGIAGSTKTFRGIREVQAYTGGTFIISSVFLNAAAPGVAVDPNTPFATLQDAIDWVDQNSLAPPCPSAGVGGP